MIHRAKRVEHEHDAPRSESLPQCRSGRSTPHTCLPRSRRTTRAEPARTSPARRVRCSRRRRARSVPGRPRSRRSTTYRVPVVRAADHRARGQQRPRRPGCSSPVPSFGTTTTAIAARANATTSFHQTWAVTPTTVRREQDGEPSREGRVPGTVPGTRPSDHVPAGRELRHRPGGIGPPVLPAGRKRKRGHDPLAFGPDGGGFLRREAPEPHGSVPARARPSRSSSCPAGPTRRAPDRTCRIRSPSASGAPGGSHTSRESPSRPTRRARSSAPRREG